jgi:hypothetical protein
MNTADFLAQLNDAEKGWGLWINRDRVSEYHVGQYAFENDRLPKDFIHVASLDKLAHQRQRYILSRMATHDNETALGQEWADGFLRQWNVCVAVS